MMTASFQRLCEAMLTKDKNAPPKVAEDDNKKIAAIKNGLNTRSQNKDSTFWDDFVQVCGDAESLAHLLGVSKYVIAGWSSKVHKYLKVVQEDMQGDDARKRNRHNMINTGDDKKDNGAANQAMGNASNPNQPTNEPASQGDMAGPNVFMRS